MFFVCFYATVCTFFFFFCVVFCDCHTNTDPSYLPCEVEASETEMSFPYTQPLYANIVNALKVLEHEILLQFLAHCLTKQTIEHLLSEVKVFTSSSIAYEVYKKLYRSFKALC